jgi:hypothetical protein
MTKHAPRLHCPRGPATGQPRQHLPPITSSPLEAVLGSNDTTRSSGADLASRSISLFRMDHSSDDHDITHRGGAK